MSCSHKNISKEPILVPVPGFIDRHQRPHKITNIAITPGAVFTHSLGTLGGEYLHNLCGVLPGFSIVTIPEDS